MNGRALMRPRPLVPLLPTAREVLQRACACGQHTGGGECEACRKKRATGLQRAVNGEPGSETMPIARDVLNSKGQPLRDHTRGTMLLHPGHDFSRVRVRNSTPPKIQTKLAVNQPGDVYEQEAERIADQIMGTSVGVVAGSAPARLQRLAVQPNSQPAAAPASVEQVLASSGRPLEPVLRRDMEQRFGYDFSGVRVYSGALAEQSAREVNAHAYTVGHSIVFGARRFAPETREGRRLLAHELAHVVQQTGGQRSTTESASMPIRAFSGAPMLARACDAVACPVVEFPLGAFVPSWQLAELCLQQNYKKSVPTNTVGFNKDWVGLSGKNSKEQATLDCFRSHYTGKGFEPDAARRRRGKKDIDVPIDRQGAAQRQAEPDIFDFTNLKIMEITTPNGLAYRSQKIVWEVGLATSLMHACSIDAPNQWAIGSWEPKPCYQIVGAGPNLAGKLFFRVWRSGGVLVYMPVLDITKEAALAATAAALAAAAAAAAGSGGAADAGAQSTTGPRWALEINKAIAAIIAAVAALGVLIATVFKPARIATLLGELLGMLLKGLGFGLTLAGGAAAGDTQSASSDGSSPGKVVPVPVPGEVTTPSDGGSNSSTRKKSKTRTVPPKQTPQKSQVVKLDLIEGLNLDGLSKGMIVPVQLSSSEGKSGVAILQVMSVVKEGNNTTAQFKALQDRMDGAPGQPGVRTKGSHKIYIVTHPHDSSEPTKLVGTVMKIGSDPQWFIDYLQNIANDLEGAGRKDEADEVRKEVQRLNARTPKAKP